MLASTSPRRAPKPVPPSSTPSGVRKAGKPQARGSPVVARVLRAAIEELARIGYGALSIEEVANRAGVNKTTVYRRWATKSELVRAALRSMGDERVCEVSTGSLRGDLLAVGRSIIAFAESSEGRSILRMLLAEGMEPELAEIAASLRREREASPRALVDEAVARGDLARGADAMLLMEALFGAIIQRLFISHEPVNDAFVQRIVDLLLCGVARAPHAKMRRVR
jgi:AcrR family transcriptional regulator